MRGITVKIKGYKTESISVIEFSNVMYIKEISLHNFCFFQKIIGSIKYMTTEVYLTTGIRQQGYICETTKYWKLSFKAPYLNTA